MAPIDYVAVANRKFSEVGRSVIPYAPKSSGYSNQMYSPNTADYRSVQKKDYNSLENKCYNC